MIPFIPTPPFHHKYNAGETSFPAPPGRQLKVIDFGLTSPWGLTFGGTQQTGDPNDGGGGEGECRLSKNHLKGKEHFL